MNKIYALLLRATKSISTTSATIHQKDSHPFYQKKGEESSSDSERQLSYKAGAKSCHHDSNTPLFNKPNTPLIQTKLTVGQPGDKYEQEADAVADTVVQKLSQGNEKNAENNEVNTPISNAVSTVQTKCTDCEQEEKIQEKEEESAIQRKPIFESNGEPPAEEIQTQSERTPTFQLKCEACANEDQLHSPNVQQKSEASESSTSSNLESRLNNSKGGGNPLTENTRSSIEGAIGSDFSGVRIHTDSSAVQMNKDLSAQAFTHGSDIYFNAGKYDTASSSGKHLLVHELTHTVQQGSSVSKVQKQENGNQDAPELDPGLASEETEWPEADVEAHEASEENAVPEGTSVEETHSTDCPQLVPPYPSEANTAAPANEESAFDLLIGIASTGGFLGVFSNMGLLGRALWYVLPDDVKIRVINIVLDAAVSGAYLQRVLGNYLPSGSFLNRILSSVLIGFYRTLRNLPDEQKLAMFNRHMRIILGGDLSFSLHYLKGIVMGFFLDGFVGIIQMVIDIICFLPKIINFFSSLTTFITNIPTELRALSVSLDAMMVEISNFLRNGMHELTELIANPSQLANFFNSIQNSINVAAESIGEKAAQAIVRFMNLSSASLGEIAGRITGQIIFEAVLIYFTATTGAGVTAAKAAIRFIGGLLMKIGKYIFRIVSYIGRILRYIKNALISAVRFLTRILRIVAQKVRVVIDKILDIFRAFKRYCRPGSIVCDVIIQIERKIAGTRGLAHSFDRHAAQWFGRPVGRSFLPQWQSLIERASRSSQVFRFSSGNSATIAHLARIEGKYFLVQFFADGPRVGEIATAFVPTRSQISQIFRILRPR